MMNNMPSLDLTFDISKGHYEMVAKWIDSIDNKIVAVFSVASLIIGLIATFRDVNPSLSFGFVLFCFGIIAFVFAGIFCWNGFKTRTFIMGNNPKKLLRQYASLGQDSTKKYLLKYWGENFERNLSILHKKSFSLRWAIRFAGIEVLLVLIWLIVV